MKYKEVLPEKTPACAIPYRKVNQPFRLQFVIPGPGIRIQEDANGVCYISTEGGMSLEDLVAGDNIEINRTEDGKLVISSVNTATNIAAGQNISIDIDPETGTAIINSIIGGPTNEHYKGVFDTPEELIAADPEPETGDYGMIKNIVVSNGETSWNGQYKYCFYINGQWTVVDQMLTFTKDLELLHQYYSVGGSSPVIYLHEVARSGDFWDLNNIPIVATPVVTVEGTTVTATCATEGAEIWYSTDGSMPHVNGTKYTGPITVAGATSFRFVGIKNGMINSLEAVVGADFSLEAPVIDYDYHTAQVTLSNPNVDGNNEPVGDVYYTIDGTEPTSASNLYVGPFNVSTNGDTNSRTVKAVVYDSGSGSYSGITSAFYNKVKTNGVINSNAESGLISQYWTYPEGPQTIVPASDGETYYTVDGTLPDYNSTPFSEALYFSRYGGSVTLKVIGYRPDWLPTNVRTIAVGYNKPTAPTISFDADTNAVTLGATGNVTAYPAIPWKTTMDNPSNGYRIYYTIDGSTPTDQSTLYTGPFQISGNVTVKAVLVAYGQYYSDVATESIVLTDAPAFSLDSDTGDLTISGPAGATLYYTTDGSEPTTESTQYTEPVNLRDNSTTGEKTVTVKAVAVVDGQESAVAEQTYKQIKSPLYKGSVNLNTGKCDIKIQNASGQSTRYTLDGSAPGPSSTLYSGDIIYDYYDTPTIKYYAIEDGCIPSGVVVVHYGALAAPDAPSITVDENTQLVTLALTGDTRSIPLQTNNNVPDMGARIWYTLDGSTPDSATGTLWTGTPFALPEGVTVIKAVTECYGEYDSAVTTENVSSEPDYFAIEALEDNIPIRLGLDYGYYYYMIHPTVEYSFDKINWEPWIMSGTSENPSSNIPIVLNKGQKVYFRGYNPNGWFEPYFYLPSFFFLPYVYDSGIQELVYLCETTGDINTLLTYDNREIPPRTEWGKAPEAPEIQWVSYS